MDQLPLPSLQLYSVISGLSLFYAVAYGLTATDGFFNALLEDVWLAAAVLNFGFCVFFNFVNFIHEFVFGRLQTTERKHMQDTFWNFLFYKFIFVFGVMNVQDMREMLLWCSWFALLGCLILTSQLCKDRFQYLSFSPTITASSHAKIIILLSLLLVSCAGLFMVCAIVGWQFGFNYFAFLFSEVYILFAKTLHTLIKYIIHLWDMHHEGMWENRNTYTYYTELVLEVSSLCVDFLHHFHMLLWANMFLSVASLILLMKLRFLYQEIQRKMKRHRNYILVNQILDKCFQPVDDNELKGEICPICWEDMTTARKLPCGHAFHFGCLRSWLEQDPVCPTCRSSLSGLLRDSGPAEQAENQRRRGRRRNWLLFFNGASIASWLPTFSLELHHQDGDTVHPNQPEFERNVEHIHSMFPHISLRSISTDLNHTHSVSQTVDNILSGTMNNLVDQPLPPVQPHLSRNQMDPESDLEEPMQSNMETETEKTDGNNASRELTTIHQKHLRQRRSSRDSKNAEYTELEPTSSHSFSSVQQQSTESSSDDKSSKDVLTFEERKIRLVSSARRRYLVRHNMADSK